MYRKIILFLVSLVFAFGYTAKAAETPFYHIGSCCKVLTPAVDNDTVFVAPESGHLFAIYHSGSLRWELSDYSITSSPAVDNDTVYVGTQNKKLLALNKSDGSVKWSFEAGGAIYSSPAISNDGSVVYFGSDDGKFYAINALNGHELWHYESNASIQTAPALYSDNKTVYFSSNDGYLYAVNTNDGSLKWNLYIGGFPASPAIGPDGIIYIGSQNGNMYAIYPYGVQKWVHYVGGWITSTPVISEDGKYVYIGTDDWNIYALKTEDGNEEWSYKTGSQIKVSPLLTSNGRVYIGSYDAVLYGLDATTGQKLDNRTLGGFISSSPVLYNGQIYVGSNDGYLYQLSIDSDNTTQVANSVWPMYKHDPKLTSYDNSTSPSDNLTITSLTAKSSTQDNVTQGYSPLTLTFTCSAKSDNNSSVKRFVWDFNGDKQIDKVTDIPGDYTTYSSTATHTFTQKGSYNVTCTVLDNKGLTASDNLTITVNTQQDNLTVAMHGFGTVTSNPSGLMCDSGVDNNKTCSALFDKDSNVYLMATPYAGYKIFAWYGDCSACNNNGSPYNTCKVVMDNDNKTCQISFKTQSEIEHNKAPTAEAIVVTTSSPARIGNVVTLEGKGSDPDNDTVDYKWSLIEKPAGSSAEITSTGANTAKFTPDVKGNYKIQLIVNDGRLDSAPISTILSVSSEDRAPTAVISVASQSVAQNVNVDLSGALSFDPDGDELNYKWKIYDPSGNDATPASYTNSTVTFTPTQTGNYSITLTVSDDGGLSDSQTIIMKVGSSENKAPIAEIKTDSTDVAINSATTLDGSDSYDPNGSLITYRWSIYDPDGNDVTPTNNTNSTITFTPTQTGSYRAMLSVSDGSLENTASVTIVIANKPVAKITTDDTSVEVGTTIHLSGADSTGTSEGVLGYAWSITSKPAGSSATLKNTNGNDASTLSEDNKNVTFTADVAGNYTVKLTVKAKNGLLEDSDTITINAYNKANARNVTIPSESISSTQTTEVPINIDNATDVAGFQFTLIYDPSVLTIDNSSSFLSYGSLTSGWSIDGHVINAGRIRIIGTRVDDTAISGSGSLAKIKFKASGSIGDKTTITFDYSDANILTDRDGNAIQFNSTPGTVTIAASGDISGDGIVDIGDVVKALKIALGIDGYNQNADMNGDGKVDIIDVILILKKALS